MRRFVDHVLCKLPFEEDWYRERGCNATYVGHPYFDQLRSEVLDAAFIAQQRAAGGPLVAILPGSRTQEVQNNFGQFLKAARIIHERVPDARFAVAAFKPSQAEMVQSQIAGSALPIEVHVRRTAELIHAADCAMAVSGSVSLELLYHTTPSVILYQISRLAFFVAAILSQGTVHHAGEFADDQGPVSQAGSRVRSEGPGRRRRAVARVPHVRR